MIAYHMYHMYHMCMYIYIWVTDKIIVIRIQSCFACNLPHLVVQDHMYFFHMLDTGVFAGEPRGTSSWFCRSMESNLKMAIFSGRKKAYHWSFRAHYLQTFPDALFGRTLWMVYVVYVLRLWVASKCTDTFKWPNLPKPVARRLHAPDA
jgi:hypothetical protein